MLVWELFKQYLFSNRSGALIRTISRLCIVGIGVAIMSLVIVISVMNGFNESIHKKLLAVEPHLVVTYPNQQNELIHSKVTSYEGAEAYSFEKQDVIIKTVSGLFGGAVAKGLEKKALQGMFQRIYESKGKNEELSELVDLDLGPREVALGIDLARSLDIFEEDEIIIIPPETLLLPAGEIPKYEKVVVKKLIYTELADVDSTMVYYAIGKTLTTFRKSASRTTGLEARLADPYNFESIKENLILAGAQVDSWVDRNSNLFLALKIEKYAMATFLGLSVLITVFSIITVLVLLIIQKRKDIGIFMAMGLTRRETKKLFVGIGLLLSIFGLGGGLTLGVLIAWVIDTFPVPILPDIYYDSTIPAKLDGEFMFWLIVLSVILAFFSSYIPVHKTVNLEPSEALRGKRR